MQSHDLKKLGLKATLPRLKILEMLESNEHRHMSAEEVYKALMETGDDIGLATVYRVLTQFESAGIVERHNFEGGHSVFELADGDHHDHLMCVKCGRIEEFVDDTIEDKQEAIAKKFGFEMTDHRLCIYGICPECRKV